MNKTLSLHLIIGFVVAIFLIPKLSFAKKDLRNGFVITNQSDTIVGRINLQSNTTNSIQCDFLPLGENKSIVYKPFEIIAYNIEGNKLYVSKKIVVNKEEREVFVELLVDGITDLYLYKDNRDKHIYLEKDGITNELLNSNKEVYKENNTGQVSKYIIEKKEYIGMLKSVLADYPSLSSKIEQSTYSSQSIAKLLVKYHEGTCDDYTCINYTKKLKNILFIEPFVGYVYSNTKIKFTNADFNQTNFTGGIQLRIVPRLSTDFLNLIIGMRYGSYQAEGAIIEYSSPYNREVQMIYKYQSIQLPIQVQYCFSNKKLQPYVSVGINNGFLFGIEHSLTYLKKFDHEDPEEYSEFRNMQIGGIGGVGCRYNLSEKINVFANAEYSFMFPIINAKYTFDHLRLADITAEFGVSVRIR